MLRISDVARRLACSTSTVRRLIADGELPATQLKRQAHVIADRRGLARELAAGALRAEHRPIKPRPTIYRTVIPSPELIERTADEGAILNLTFALFDRWQLIDNPLEGRFMERIQRGAFAKSIKENLRNVRAVLSHGKDPSLGNTVLGTIEAIEEGADGASARVSLFRSVPGLLLDGLKAGVYGASFRGDALKNHVERRPGRSTSNPEGLPQVTRLEIRLKDLGPTPFAAYQGTSAKVDGALALVLSLAARRATRGSAVLGARKERVRAVLAAQP
jgi:excisionase family DNA binding protein